MPGKSAFSFILSLGKGTSSFHTIFAILLLFCGSIEINLAVSTSTSFTCQNKLPIGISSMDSEYANKPYVNGAVKFLHGIISPWEGHAENVSSPIFDTETNQRIVIGSMAQMGEAEAVEAVESAKRAWDNGQGQWPQMSAADRITALENVVKSLKEKRAEIVNVLMWEIAKNSADAATEFG